MLAWRCEKCFVQLKEYLVHASIFAFPDFNEAFQLKKDVSGVGLGAVLSQAHKEFGRNLQTHEKNYVKN